METVKERPILFSGAMIRRILKGAKSQTRRILSPQPEKYEQGKDWGLTWKKKCGGGSDWLVKWCPYGKVGERLWVRESLREEPDGWVYDADKTPIEMDADDPRAPAMISWAHHVERAFCVSIHMPRWASRVTLEITGVRVERLSEIHRRDVQAEGFMCRHCKGYTDNSLGCICVDEFSKGWDTINGKRAMWSSNPYVWAISFKRVS